MDGLVLAVAASVVTMLLGLDRTTPLGVDSYVRTALSGVLNAAIYVAYFAYGESGGRQTLGKRCLGVNVVGPDGGDISLVQAVTRNVWLACGVAAVVPVVGPLLGGVAAVAAVVTISVGINSDETHGRGWHDKLAGGARVVRLT
ncbi:hypothetical protein ASG94_21120 [Nocardioides sp. Soil805]|nr:hypothetical protein ASG94_21120 [Nocardioides sp. Soil805]